MGTKGYMAPEMAKLLNQVRPSLYTYLSCLSGVQSIRVYFFLVDCFLRVLERVLTCRLCFLFSRISQDVLCGFMVRVWGVGAGCC